MMASNAHRKTLSTFNLEGRPDERILLYHLAKKFECTVRTNEHNGILVVMGDSINVNMTRKTFYYLCSRIMLREALLKSQYPQANPRHVEAQFRQGFVNRTIEYMNPETEFQRINLLKRPYAKAGYALAEEVFNHGR